MEINDIDWNINEFNTVMNRITLMAKLLLDISEFNAILN